jgi:tetratricopeptide (TPR) repeat protein
MGPDAPRLGPRLVNAAEEDDRTHPARSRAELARALAIAEKAYGPEHPEVGTALMAMAGLAMEQHKWDEAERLYRRALAMVEKAYGPDHLEVGYVLHNLATNIYWQGRTAGALPYLQRAVAVMDRALGANNVAVGKWLGDEAQVLYELGRWTELRPVLERMLTKPVVDTLSRYQLAAAHFELGDTLAHQGRERARAVALVRGAVTEARASDDEDAPELRAQIATWLERHR